MSRRRLSRGRRVARLARWLGPWAGASEMPSRVERTVLQLPASGGPVRCYRYEPTDVAVSGCYVVAPGLHYAAADDPRFDRFCRALATAGLVVVTPFLRPYLALVISSAAADDLEVAWQYAASLCAARSLPRPALFTISFGSCPALELAQREPYRHQIGGLVLFGAFFDFHALARFAISRRAYDGEREIHLSHDPLNAPAVFINLLPFIEAPEPRESLQEAWLEMARRTWGRLEMRPRRRREPIAEMLAAQLPVEQRELFAIGCGLAPGGPALVESGLANAGSHFSFANAGPRVRGLAAPVLIAHGRDDDVIPFSESKKLQAALPPGHPHRLALTGMYGHTSSSLPSASELVSELRSLRELLFAMVDAPHEELFSGLH